MKILVTGHKGFIGGHIYNYLKSNNYDVYGYDLGDELNPFLLNFNPDLTSEYTAASGCSAFNLSI